MKLPASRTDEDVTEYIEQSKYVSQFRKMVKDEKIQKVVIIPREEKEALESVEAKAVMIPAPVEHGRGRGRGRIQPLPKLRLYEKLRSRSIVKIRFKQQLNTIIMELGIKTRNRILDAIKEDRRELSQ